MTKLLFILLFQVQTASYYGKGFIGRKTANGELYTGKEFTAAHKSLPFGTRVRITNVDNSKSVIIRVNDRGPFVGKRSFDLSIKAFESLTDRSTGLIKISVEILDSVHLSYRRRRRSLKKLFKLETTKVFTVVEKKIIKVEQNHLHLFSKCFTKGDVTY